jgi:hypothetical protein
MTEHTPTPWAVEDTGCGIEIVSGNFVVAEILPADGKDPTDQDRANAAFIVRACNAHDELVRALEAIAECATPDFDDAGFQRRARIDLQNIARAAIRKARGE